MKKAAGARTGGLIVKTFDQARKLVGTHLTGTHAVNGPSPFSHLETVAATSRWWATGNDWWWAALRCNLLTRRHRNFATNLLHLRAWHTLDNTATTLINELLTLHDGYRNVRNYHSIGRLAASLWARIITTGRLSPRWGCEKAHAQRW